MQYPRGYNKKILLYRTEQQVDVFCFSQYNFNFKILYNKYTRKINNYHLMKVFLRIYCEKYF